MRPGRRRVRLFAALLLPLLGLAAGNHGGPSRAAAGPKPNIILYVIDGAAADLMSVYGYERRTTRHLERLAAEGAVFENAYSNSSITKISVPSFMTSLHGSVLGGFRSGSDPLPDRAVTMAERLRRAGYATEVLTSNPYCGRISGLDRGVDIMRDGGRGDARPSSAGLHREFWRLRADHPAEPYWVHFQTTDIHRPWTVSPRARGLLPGPEEMRALDEMLGPPFGRAGLPREGRAGNGNADRDRLLRTARKLYEESMIFQDREIGRLVEGLKKRGEWERTLFIVASDHGHVAAGLPFHDPQAPPWGSPVLASQRSRIPLIFVWPGKIPAGRRMSQPVSMIDLLPTVLDLAGLPRAEVAQGQSLVPLLLGKRGWKPKPVVFDEFYLHGGELRGSIEVIDGRWGASLRIDRRPREEAAAHGRQRPAPLLLFDVASDPHALRSLHEERPDLAERYSKLLLRLWREHRALASRFHRGEALPMTREEVERLRSLGYLR